MCSRLNGVEICRLCRCELIILYVRMRALPSSNIGMYASSFVLTLPPFVDVVLGVECVVSCFVVSLVSTPSAENMRPQQASSAIHTIGDNQCDLNSFKLYRVAILTQDSSGILSLTHKCYQLNSRRSHVFPPPLQSPPPPTTMT